MRCTKCGKENPEGAVYCRNCGAKLDINDLELVKAEPTETEIVTDFSGTGFEFLPGYAEERLKDVTYQKYPLSNLAALGVSVQPMTVAIQNIVGGGAGRSGFYYVDTKGLEMFRGSDGAGFIGSLKSSSGAVGGGQAVLKQIPLDPTMVFMSAALMNIEKQLANIQEMQQEMMDFLKAQEKAKLRGNINTLIDVLNNFKYNVDNDTYKTNKHILVQDIRREADQSIQLSRDLLRNVLKKKDIIASNQKVNAKLDKVEEYLKDYQMALFLYAFSSFLEIVLLSNYDSEYINGMLAKIKDLSDQYREYYEACYGRIEKMSKRTAGNVLAGGAAGISKGAGTLIGNIPVIKRGLLDEMLLAAGSKFDDVKTNMVGKKLGRIAELAGNGTATFVQRIEEMNWIYNKPKDIIIDRNNLYLIDAG